MIAAYARVAPRALLGLAWLFLLASSSVSVEAQSAAGHALGAAVDVLAGYDSNPTLAVGPNARRDQGVILDGPDAGGVISMLPRVYASWFARDHSSRFSIALSSDARVYHSGDARHDSFALLSAGTQLAAMWLALDLEVGRYDASFGADDAWYGGLTPSIRVPLSRLWSIGVQASIAARRYAGGAQVNRDVGGAADLRFSLGAWSALIGLDLDRRQSTIDAAERTQATPFAQVSWSDTPWLLSARYASYARWFDVAAQDGAEHIAEIDLRYQLGSVASLICRMGLGVARGDSDALRYERGYAWLGLNITIDGSRRTMAGALPDRTQQGPVVLDAGVARFELCRANAREVAVVGTFNDWSAERGRMERDHNGCFTTQLAVRAGHHRYQWLVDGALTSPDGAPAYAADDFGGRDAVLIVP